LHTCNDTELYQRFYSKRITEALSFLRGCFHCFSLGRLVLVQTQLWGAKLGQMTAIGC